MEERENRIYSLYDFNFSLCVHDSIHGKGKEDVQVTKGWQRYVFPASFEKICWRYKIISCESGSGAHHLSMQ